MQYDIEKEVWSEADFSDMGWHDAKIWGILAEEKSFEFLIDLDYIFAWVNPAGDRDGFSFWVSPVTMVFDNAVDVSIDIKSRQGIIEVSDLHMRNERLTPNKRFTEYDFIFECQEGEIKVTATGYKMYVRKRPVHQSLQWLEYSERGGVDFGRVLLDI